MENVYGTSKIDELKKSGILKKEKAKTMKVQANMKEKTAHTLDEQSMYYHTFLKG